MDYGNDFCKKPHEREVWFWRLSFFCEKKNKRYFYGNWLNKHNKLPFFLESAA